MTDASSSRRLEDHLERLFAPPEIEDVRALARHVRGRWIEEGSFSGWLQEPGAMPVALKGIWEPPHLLGSCSRCQTPAEPCVHLAALVCHLQAPAEPEPDPEPEVVPEAEVAREVVLPCRPRLVLGGWNVRGAQGDVQRHDGAMLQFVYGNRAVPEGGSAVRIEWKEDGEDRFCRRDPVREEAVRKELERLEILPRQHRRIRSLPENASEDWIDFLARERARLEVLGWIVVVESNWDLSWVEPTCWEGEWKAGTGDWFSLSLHIEVDGEPVELVELCRQILEGPQAQAVLARLQSGRSIVLVLHGQKVRFAPERLLPILTTLSFLLEGTRKELRVPGILAAQIQDMGWGVDAWKGLDALTQVRARLDSMKAPEPVPPAQGLRASLRSYQQQGLDWLQWLRGHGFGGILADDMGLGKTLQTISHILHEVESGRQTVPSLVICPTSLVANWESEIRRFAPDLKIVVLHGASRQGRREQVDVADVAITTYPLLARDEDWLVERRWHLLVLDEAHTLKNSRSQARQVTARLCARHWLALSGTPLENHLGELWSLFDLLHPGLLGSLQRFTRQVRAPIEKGGNVEMRQRLGQFLSPFLLRRTKQQVATELPEKTEIVQVVELQGRQRDLYETVRVTQDAHLQEILEDKGWETSSLEILEALLRIRQVCCDPRLLPPDLARGCTTSAKMEWLTDVLPEMVEEGRRILVFSQFTSFLDLVGKMLTHNLIDFARLDGSTRDRGAVVRRFQEGEVPVFLLSLKAGGTGLNLTRADTVIFLDPWWNPAIERQAADRAYRIGQTQPVFVYRLVAKGTIEERILALQARKSELADAILEGGGAASLQFTRTELEELLRPLGSGSATAIPGAE